MLSRRRFTALTLATAALPVIAPATAAQAATAAPWTAPVPGATVVPGAATAQLRWLLDVLGRAPVPADELRQHFAAGFLEAFGGPDGLNGFLGSVGPQYLVEIVVERPDVVQAHTRGAVAACITSVRLDAAGLIAGLLFGPYPARSWSELDARLRRLAPRVSFAVATLDAGGRCRVVHGVNADTPRPLGSAFKLYVLGALGQAAADGRVGWDQPLAIRDDWKSLPSGVLQDRPAGTTLPLREYANHMIEISDNTATDHLIHALGRDTVEAQLARFGNREVRANTPFLTTREAFTLKWYRYPTVARQYLALPRAHRAAALHRLARVPLEAISFVPEPRLTDRIEWFGSPLDICRAYAGLRRMDSRPVGDALSISDGGIGLDRRRFPVVWCKGGSEPGVLTASYLVVTVAGQVVVGSAMLHDPDRLLAETPARIEALGLIRGGIELAVS